MYSNDKTSRFDPDGDTQPFRPDETNADTRPVQTNLPQYYPGMMEEPHGSGETQPLLTGEPLSRFQAIPVKSKKKPRPKKRRSFSLFWLLALAAVLYFLAPLRTNLVILGIDRVPDGTAMGRSDTIILVSVVPLKPTVNMLSIPRDLFIDIPGVGADRINTAHFYAEVNRPGSGPDALAAAIENNFGVPVPYYLRIRFDGFLGILNAMGGVTVDLPAPMAGYPEGRQHLDPEQALAFARDRQGADDFFRMQHAQVLVRGAMSQMINPASWARIPAVAAAGFNAIDTNAPLWQWPRLGFAFLRGGLTGTIDSRTVAREMTTPWVTDGGAQVLLPNWDLIRPLMREMFGR